MKIIFFSCIGFIFLYSNEINPELLKIYKERQNNSANYKIEKTTEKKDIISKFNKTKNRIESYEESYKKIKNNKYFKKIF